MDLVNELRQANGLPELRYNAELSKVAYDKAKDMVEKNYFSHHAVSYGSPFEMMKCYGIVFTKAAENIAGNQTVEGAFYAWTSSNDHKANILNEEYTDTGIGIYQSPVYGKIVVQMFITISKKDMNLIWSMSFFCMLYQFYIKFLCFFLIFLWKFRRISERQCR